MASAAQYLRWPGVLVAALILAACEVDYGDSYSEGDCHGHSYHYKHCNGHCTVPPPPCCDQEQCYPPGPLWPADEDDAGTDGGAQRVVDGGNPPSSDGGGQLPVDAGTPPPVDAGSPPPQDAGSPPPADAGGSEECDGTGLLKINLEFKGKRGVDWSDLLDANGQLKVPVQVLVHPSDNSQSDQELELDAHGEGWARLPAGKYELFLLGRAGDYQRGRIVIPVKACFEVDLTIRLYGHP